MKVTLTHPPAIWRIGYIDDQGGSVWYVLAHTKEEAITALKRHWGLAADTAVQGRLYAEEVLAKIGDVDRGGFI